MTRHRWRRRSRTRLATLATSIDFQGYLNGAVDIGETAAKHVIRRAT